MTAFADPSPEGNALLQRIAASKLMSAYDELRITREIKRHRQLIEHYEKAYVGETDPLIISHFGQLISESLEVIDDLSEQLFHANVRWVLKLVNKSSRLEFMDRFQWGAIGLWRAIRLYDPDRLVDGHPVRLNTYATYWIRQSMQRGADQDERLIRIPVGATETLKRLQDAQQAFIHKNGYTPSLTELCAEANIDIETARRLQQANNIPLSLSYQTEQDSDSGSDGLMLANVITAEYDQIEEHFVEQAHRELLRGNVRDAVDAMEMYHEIDQRTGNAVYPYTRHAQVLRLRYRISEPSPVGNTPECRTLEEVGAMINPPVTRERVRQLQRDGIRWIREHCPYLRAFAGTAIDDDEQCDDQ